MRDPQRYEKTLSQPITSELLSSIPESLHDRIVTEVKRFIHPDDYSSYLEDYGDDFDTAYEDLAIKDLTHEFIASTLDPDAYNLTYLEFAHENDGVFHGVIARGGNPMGFVLTASGELMYEIYDGCVRTPGDGSFSMNPDQTAVHAMVFFADVGQTVHDTKDEIKRRDEKAYTELFNEPIVDIPIIGYRLADIPDFMTAEISADSDVRNCFFYVARSSDDTRPLFADNPEPPIDDVNAGLKVAAYAATSATKSRNLFEFLRPGESGGGSRYGGSWNVGFHTADGEKIEQWFRDQKFKIVPITELFKDLYFVKVTNKEGEPVNALKYTSAVINAGLEYDVREVMPGIYAFDALDRSYEEFSLLSGTEQVVIKAEQLKAGELIDVQLT